MEDTTIGIKIADGSFTPIFDRSYRGKRKLVLTTVRDNQESVQIDLHQGSGESLESPEYIGSLVVENITPAPKGTPEINLLVGIDDAGNLNATATDTSSGEYQSLSVSLSSLDSGGSDLPDFSLEEPVVDDDFDFSFDDDEEEGFEDERQADTAEGSFEESEEPDFAGGFDSEIAESLDDSFAESSEEGSGGRRRLHGFLFAGFILLSLAALALLTYFIFRALRGPELPTLEATLLQSGRLLNGHAVLGVAAWFRRSSLV